MKHIEINNNGFTTQMYEYKEFKIHRAHSSEQFKIRYNGWVYAQKDRMYKLTLTKIKELIDNNKIFDYYEAYVKER